MTIHYQKGDLFEGAPVGALLAHACNGLGMWGAGIAAQFAKRFPDEYRDYRKACDTLGKGETGRTFVVGRVACLVTSYGIGGGKDSVDQIVSATELAAEELFAHMPGNALEIHSPKINSGIFGVPWELTEAALLRAIRATDRQIKWIVWELE